MAIGIAQENIAFGNLKLKAQEWIAKLPRIKSFTQWFGKT